MAPCVVGGWFRSSDTPPTALPSATYACLAIFPGDPAGSCDSSPAVLLEAGSAEPRPLPGICGGWLTGDHVLDTDEVQPLAGGAARPLRLNGWLVDAVVPGGLVRLVDEQCEFTGERYTFVAVRLLLADGPAAPPRCSPR